MVNYLCKSKKQYDKYIVKEYVSGYLCGYIRDDVEKWKEVYGKIEKNKENHMKYLKEFDVIKEKYWTKSYQKINKETALYFFTPYQYANFELKLCESQKLIVTTSMLFIFAV